jgi:mono/diheme cytochrome c family protein
MRNVKVNTSHFLRVIFSSFLVALAFGVLYSATASASDAVERGTGNYLQFCQGCHGADKAGLVNFQGGLEDLQAILDGETNQMPDFYGVFSEDEVADIYAFLKASD